MSENILTSSVDVLTKISRLTTEKITTTLINNGIQVTQRWTGLLLFFLSALIIYLGIKLTQPVLRIILIILGVILIGGLFVPTW